MVTAELVFLLCGDLRVLSRWCRLQGAGQKWQYAEHIANRTIADLHKELRDFEDDLHDAKQCPGPSFK